MTATQNAYLSIDYNDYVIECRGAWLRPRTHHGVTVLTIGGEIDASNADQVREHAHRYASAAPALVVDMASVEFFGVIGLRNLMVLGQKCQNAGVEWALIASGSVSRLLRVAEVDRALPVAESVSAALQRFTSGGTPPRTPGGGTPPRCAGGYSLAAQIKPIEAAGPLCALPVS